MAVSSNCLLEAMIVVSMLSCGMYALINLVV